MKQITDKTHIIILTNNLRIWITEKEFELFKGLISAGKSFVEIAGNVINMSKVLFAGPRANIDEVDRIKRGGWKCDYGFWHSKGEECGHRDEKKYKIG